MPASLRRLVTALPLAAAALAAAPAHAADQARVRALLTEDLVPDWIESHVEDMGAEWSLLPFEDMDAAARAIPRHFDPKAIFDEVAAAAAAALSDADLEAILAWRGSDVGARFVAAEQDYEAAPCGMGAPECGDALGRLEIAEDPRVPAIRAVNDNGLFAEIQLAIDVAILRAAWQEAPEPPDRADLAEMLRAYAEAARPDLLRWHQSLSAEIYAPFTAGEIAAYADFLASPPARAYMLSTGKALRDAMAEGAEGLSRELAARPPTRAL